ncbi:PREDICTED: cytochrome P450 2F1-like [Rhinopithecus bieti]|uniref:cytochrome P450 2F1-like n=1 Tax=Rhinopithecus bieti TaxID=61621 RepID=UPI00083C6861|nr:PREDICTED: cytochrome P450 2F1-like [Rhinopithecus bieti]
MPYTDAVIHQVQRFADIIPMNLPHRLTQDTAFCGFLIPKGTDIITLLNIIHYDPSQFLMPQEFNPEHFWMPISPSRRAQPSRPSQPGAVCAWASRWRAWSSFCTSPPSCRASRCSRWVCPRTST